MTPELELYIKQQMIAAQADTTAAIKSNNAVLEEKYFLVRNEKWLRYTLVAITSLVGIVWSTVQLALNSGAAAIATKETLALRAEAQMSSDALENIVESLQGGDQTKGYFRLGDTVICYGREPATVAPESKHARHVAFDFPKEVQYSEAPQVSLTVHSQGGSAMFAISVSTSEKDRFSAGLNNTRQWSERENAALDGGVTTTDVQVTYIAIGKGKINAAATTTP